LTEIFKYDKFSISLIRNNNWIKYWERE